MKLKKLIVYYSFEGSTEIIAKAIADEVNADVLQLKPKNDIKTHGFSKYFIGGRQSIKKVESELYPIDKKPEDYDVIFIGTPVWAGTITPALRTFLKQEKFSNKKLGLFCCHMGAKKNTFKVIKEMTQNNEICGEMDFTKVKKDKSTKEKQAKDWAKSIITNLEK